MNDITSQNLTELIKNIKYKKISSEETTKNFIEKAEKAKTLNCYITEDFDSAIKKAKKFDSKPNFKYKLPGVPIVTGVKLDARADAEPPEDPPGTKFLSMGLCTFPKKLVSFDEPIANSSQFNFPRRIPPSFQRFWVTVDS